MDKGIKNNRQGSITFHTDKGDVVLLPGYNRLTQEQFDGIKKHSLFGPYTEPTERNETEFSLDKETGMQVSKQIKAKEFAYLEVVGDIPPAEVAPAPAPAPNQGGNNGNRR